MRLVRPVVIYGVIIAAMMSILTHFLIPASLSQLKQRQAEVSRNITAKLLTAGEFLHPAPGITFYIRHITPVGELQNVFLSDRRDRANPVAYTSSTAYLVQEGGGTKLVMVKGLAQNLNREQNRLFTTHFDDFSYDISTLVSRDAIDLSNVAYADTADLLMRPEAVAENAGVRLGTVAFEAHNRIAQALMCVVAAAIGFATLLLGTYSRFGVWRQVVIAFFLLVGVKVIESVVSGPVLTNAALWPLMYLPIAIGGVLTVILLHVAANPRVVRLFRRRAAAEDAP